MGFGIVDNAMMVMSGEAIDHTLGLMLGLSTLAAAALGNSFSNGESGPAGRHRTDSLDNASHAPLNARQVSAWFFMARSSVSPARSVCLTQG